jgi:phosphate transport system permease protein
MKQTKNLSEFIITRLIKISGYSAIIFVGMIFYFLLREGLPAVFEVNLSNFTSTRWYPIEDYFGILPLIGGSLMITFGAAIIVIPFGIGSAVYLSEIAPQGIRETFKPIVEVLGGLPSVVLGFLGMVVIAPFLQQNFRLPTGLTAFTGSLLLGGISLPTVISVAEDALNTVPKSYRDASLAIGATRWQTIWRVTLPAARSGVLTAIMLGIGRSIGETMAVMMVTGNAPIIPSGITDIFSPARTMTATIAAEMGEVAKGSIHYHVLFFIGIILFMISLIVNITASTVVFSQRKRQERILS